MASEEHGGGVRQRRFARRTILRAGALTTAGLGSGFSAAFLAACSGSSNNGNKAAVVATTGTSSKATPSTGGATQAPGNATAAAQAQPKHGGKLAFGQVTNPAHFDLQQLGGSTPGFPYNRLIRREVGPNYSGEQGIKPIGDLATKWEQPDDLTYLFHLQSNVKFHNIDPVNGRQMVADDVVYSANRQLALKVNAGSLYGITKFEAPDPATVKLTLDKPNADLLAILTSSANIVVAKEQVEKQGDLKNPPQIGTGAWIFKEYVPSSYLRFVRNPDYFRQGLPYADELNFLIIPDSSTALAAFRTKQILALNPGATDPRVADVERYKKEIPGLIVHYGLENTGGGTSHMLRADLPPFTDIRVRQAIQKVIDRNQIAQTVLGGAPADVYPAAAAMLSIDGQDQLLPEDQIQRLLAPDVATAKQLAQAAGFTGTKSDLWYGTYPPNAPISEVISQELKPLGVDVTLRVSDSGTTGRWLSEHDLPWVVNTSGYGVFGTTAYLNSRYKTGGTRNVSRMSDPQIDSLIDAQGIELKDRQKRNQLLFQIQQKVIDFASEPPLGIVKTFVVTHPFVHDFFLGYTTEPTVYDGIWLDQ